VIAPTCQAADVTARRQRGDWVLSGTAPLVDNATRAALFLVPARLDERRAAWFLVEREAAGVHVAAPEPLLGTRALGRAALRVEAAATPPAALLGGVEGRGAEQAEAVLALARLGLAATAVGVAQAAFDASLRYSQQRSTFGKPICEHQAIQLKLADMATRLTAARLLTYRSAERLEATPRDLVTVALAKILAAETAADVTLEAMRIHGGYGYTTEFPVERYYRDAVRLLVVPVGHDAERARLACLLAAPEP
jgi:alkylation response protein AidB-like acyl-CoA dehydrogenase